MIISQGLFITKGGMSATVVKIKGEVNRWTGFGSISIPETNVTVLAKWDSFGRIFYPSTDPSFDLASKIEQADE